MATKKRTLAYRNDQFSGFSARLRYVMDRKNISQAALAEGIGVSRPRVSDWLNEKITAPQRATLRKLAVFFDCSIDWLADGVGDPFATGERSLSIVGNGNIQAGRRVVKISGGAKVGRSDQQQSPVCVLDEDEERFIALVREVGGKQALRKFEAELLRLKQIIDKELK